MNNSISDVKTASAFSIQPVPMMSESIGQGLTTNNAQKEKNQSNSSPSTPKGQLSKPKMLGHEFIQQEEEITNTTRRRKISEVYDSNNEQVKARLAYGALTENDNFSQVDSVQSAPTSSTEILNKDQAVPTPAFDAVLQPFVKTLPQQIAQHSVFTLPKPTFNATPAELPVAR